MKTVKKYVKTATKKGYQVATEELTKYFASLQGITVDPKTIKRITDASDSNINKNGLYGHYGDPVLSSIGTKHHN